jgi:hypothetical protein
VGKYPNQVIGNKGLLADNLPGDRCSCSIQNHPQMPVWNNISPGPWLGHFIRTANYNSLYSHVQLPKATPKYHPDLFPWLTPCCKHPSKPRHWWFLSHLAKISLSPSLKMLFQRDILGWFWIEYEIKFSLYTIFISSYITYHLT